MYQIKLNLYPNREMRATLTKERTRIFNEDESSSSSSSEGGVGLGDAGSGTLDISAELENPLEPAPRAASKFGLNAKRTLLRIGGALDENDPNPGNGLFFTGTLPGSTPAALSAIAAEASWLVHRTKAWVATYVPSKLDFYVWELQRRGALHLHYYVYCPSADIRARLMAGWKQEWAGLLLAVGLKHGCEMFRRGFGDFCLHPVEKLQAYCQEVRKGVGAYLSKYCSKGLDANSNRHEKYFPKRWWGCSRPLTALLREKTSEQTFRFSRLSEAESWLEGLREETAPLSEREYRYHHRAGIGVTVIQYALPWAWKILKQQVVQMFPSLAKSPQYDSSSFPEYESILRAVSAEYLGKKHLVSAVNLAAARHYLSKLEEFQLLDRSLLSWELVVLRKILCECSFLFTCQALRRFQSAAGAEEHSARIRFIWAVDRRNGDSAPFTDRKCKDLLQIYDFETQKIQTRTRPAETSPTPPAPIEPEPSSLGSEQPSLF